MNNLNRLMNDYGYTKETIANELKVTVLAVDNWLRGRNGIGEENQLKLSKLLEKVNEKRVKEQANTVVIPKYVANVIEMAKNEGAELLGLSQYIWRLKKEGNKTGEKAFDWLTRHDTTAKSNEVQEEIAVAWIDGYEVEEAKYVVIISEQFTGTHPAFGVWSCYVEHTTIKEDGSVKQYKGIDNCYFNPITEERPCFSKEKHPITTDAIKQDTKYKFTESELKEIDKRLFAFAKKTN